MEEPGAGSQKLVKMEEQTQGERDHHGTRGKDISQGSSRIGASQPQNARLWRESVILLIS